MQRTAFMTVAEVAETLGISKSHAYKIVHRLNQELKDKGFITIAGRINRRYGVLYCRKAVMKSHGKRLLDGVVK